jgi:hypothetical protein
VIEYFSLCKAWVDPQNHNDQDVSNFSFFLSFFFFQYWGLNSRYTPWATHDGSSRDRISWTICLGWLQTVILLISASWVAKITDMSTAAQLIFFWFGLGFFCMCVCFFNIGGWTQGFSIWPVPLEHITTLFALVLFV